MQWLYNLDELQYEKFLTILFTYCDHVTCVGSEVQCLKFSGIIYECIGRRPLEMQNLYSSDWENASIYQYSFVCSEKTKEWFKQQSFYRLHWQMIDLHALTFWKEGQCVFRVLTNHYVEFEIDEVLERQIFHLFEKSQKYK